MTPPRPLLAAALLAALAIPTPARADIPTPNSTQCNSKKQGDDCTTDNGKAGACTPSKCGRLDYSNGVPPKSVEWDCLICNPDARKGCGCSLPGDASPGWPLAACLPLLLGLRRHRRPRR